MKQLTELTGSDYRHALCADSVGSSTQLGDNGAVEPVDVETACDFADACDDCNDVEIDVDLCNGIQPIMIEPDANNESDADDDDIGTVREAVGQSGPTAGSVDPQAGVQMLYCGTLTGNSLLAPLVLSELAQNLVAGFRSPQSVESLKSITNTTNSCCSATTDVEFRSVSAAAVTGGDEHDVEIVTMDHSEVSFSDVEPDDITESRLVDVVMRCEYMIFIAACVLTSS